MRQCIYNPRGKAKQIVWREGEDRPLTPRLRAAECPVPREGEEGRGQRQMGGGGRSEGARVSGDMKQVREMRQSEVRMAL